MSKFQIGDRVRSTMNHDLGTVQGLELRVKWDDGGYTSMCSEDYVELAPDRPKFQIGDKVLWCGDPATVVGAWSFAWWPTFFYQLETGSGYRKGREEEITACDS